MLDNLSFGVFREARMVESGFRQSLTADEKEALSKLLDALTPFRNLRPTMPLQSVITFLLVALQEGDSVTEYARKAGVAQTVMTRHLLDIGDRNRHKEPGLGLVTQRADPLNLRRHQTLLAQRGKQVAHDLVRILTKRR